MSIITTEQLFDHQIKRVLERLNKERIDCIKRGDAEEGIALDAFSWDNLEILGRIAYEHIGEYYGGDLDSALEEVSE